MYVIIVVPCYNEANRLDTAQFERFEFPEGKLEFCFVNDGSRDETLQRLEEMSQRAPERCWSLNLPVNSGKAEAVRQGVLAAIERNPDYIGFWDADLATPLDEIGRFCSVFAEHPDVEMVTGARVKLLGRNIARRTMRHYLGRVGATLISLTLKLPIYDTQCGAKIFRVNEHLREAFGSPFITKWIFDVEVIARYEVIAKRGGAPINDRIYELPLKKWTDVEGSKVRSRDFIRSLVDLRKIWKKYLR